MIIFFLTIILLGLILPADAHAYLDPGTGSYLLQIVIASLFGILISIRMFWGRIKTFFAKLFSRNSMNDRT